MTKGLRLRHLSFHGPVRKRATIAFGVGLNVIYGASNTGKSFIVDAIDFMLGGKGPLRDIPERVGYDQVLLAMETLEGHKFTLVRSTAGGAFRIFDGLYYDTLPEGEGATLSDIHSERNDDNLSAYLLAKLDLAHKRVSRCYFLASGTKRNSPLLPVRGSMMPMRRPSRSYTMYEPARPVIGTYRWPLLSDGFERGTPSLARPMLDQEQAMNVPAAILPARLRQKAKASCTLLERFVVYIHSDRTVASRRS